MTYTRKGGIIIKDNTASPCIRGEQKPRELFNYCHARLLRSQYLCWVSAEGQGVKYPYCTGGNSACVNSGAQPSCRGVCACPSWDAEADQAGLVHLPQCWAMRRLHISLMECLVQSFCDGAKLMFYLVFQVPAFRCGTA